MTIRILSFIIVFLSALFSPIWFFLLLSILYGFVYMPYELLIIGLLIDAQFGDVSYIYTALITIISVLLILLKPRLRIFHQN